eukprot:scaffold1978_cov209-Pinguiococcus_pyrenoidosus.AAC.2
MAAASDTIRIDRYSATASSRRRWCRCPPASLSRRADEGLKPLQSMPSPPASTVVVAGERQRPLC